jgi:hypothetical protein
LLIVPKKKFKLKISQPILILSTGNAESLYPSMSYMLKQKNSRKFVSYRHITKNLIQLNPYVGGALEDKFCCYKRYWLMFDMVCGKRQREKYKYFCGNEIWKSELTS